MGYGDLIGLFIHQCAAQVVLAGHRNGRENGGAAAMVGFFAVHDYQFVGGHSAQLLLHRQQLLIEFDCINA